MPRLASLFISVLPKMDLVPTLLVRALVCSAA